MALGTAAIIAQLLGAGANYLIGRGQESEGEELAQQGREDLLATAGPTAALLAGVDEQKSLIKDAQARGQRQLDTSVAGFLDALQSGAPTASALVPSFAGSVADASSDLGARTAQAMAAANQPAIDAAESAMDVSRSLAGMDLQQGTEAFNQGRQTQYNAFGQALGIPMDLATLQTANPDAFSNLFPNLAEGAKIGQQGTYTGGGINMKTVKSLLDAMPQKEKKEEEDKKKNKKRVGEATDTVDKVNNLAARGGVMRPGDTLRTKGPEDHDKQEYDIVDAETGQTVAKTTGQEDHTVNEDGSMTVLNSDQSGSIHDAFKDVDVPMLLKFLEKYPQKSQVRDLMSALNVFTLPQFQD
tara:strand:- start:20909 stop:21976 length:1068 start_codon:yes stop_codon:yes gene_type:complete